MDFDDMLVELGELGKYQLTTYFLICLPVLFAAANSLTYVFTAGVPNYRCFIPECDDLQDPQYLTDWIQNAIPNDKNLINNDYVPAHCTRFIRKNLTDYMSCTQDIFSSEREDCDRWVFDEERTIVNDWVITCEENEWKLSLVGSFHFAGIVVGTTVFGILADKYGRKLILLISIFIMCIFGVAQVYSNSYIMFCTFIFLNSVGTAGIFPMAFILGVEMVGAKHRELTGIVLNYFYAIGEALVALIAWLAEDWQITQLFVSAPCVMFIVYYWLVPESVRWLLAKDKTQRAKGIVCKVAKFNKVTLSPSLLNSFNNETVQLNINFNPESIKQEQKAWTIFIDMIKSRKLVLRFTAVFYIWAVNAFIYYGLSVNSTRMGGNKYLNFALVCLIEIPGYTLSWVCIKKFGRRASLIMSLLLCGITCSISVLVPNDLNWAIIVLFLIGKLGITSSFGVVFVHTAEMLPTMVRSGGVGIASTIARFGALLAPFVPLLGTIFPQLPMLLFGLIGISAGLVAFYLPETLGMKLPETVAEAEHI